MKNYWESIIRRGIKDSGLSLCELGRRSGISVAQLSRFMNGKRTIKILTAEKIAKHIGVELKLKGVKDGRSNKKRK